LLFSFVDLIFFIFLVRNVLVNNFFQFLSLLSFWNAESYDELENIPIPEDVYFFLPEKLVNVKNISPQEIKSVRVVMLYRLRNIDNKHFVLPVKHVVFAQVCVD
jgi:hypothetical protein